MNKSIYSKKDINQALLAAEKAIEGATQVMRSFGNEHDAHVMMTAAFSFDQVMRATLRLDNTEDEVVDRP